MKNDINTVFLIDTISYNLNEIIYLRITVIIDFLLFKNTVCGHLKILKLKNKNDFFLKMFRLQRYTYLRICSLPFHLFS